MDMHQARTCPEDELLAAAQAGDRAALGQLLRRHHHGVYRYGLSVCRTSEDAEDALQETLWTTTRAIRTFRGSAASVVSWMFTIIRRECLRLIDRYRGVPLEPEQAESIPDETPDPIQTMDEARRAELLATALASLEPTQREVVLLRDIEELSAPEAAARLGISVDALKSRLHRARVNLREHVLAHAER